PADHHHARVRIETVGPGRPRPRVVLRRCPDGRWIIYQESCYGRARRSTVVAGECATDALHGTRRAPPCRDRGSSSGLEVEVAGRRMDLDLPCGGRAVFGFVEHTGGLVQPANPLARHTLRASLARTNAHSLALRWRGESREERKFFPRDFTRLI